MKTVVLSLKARRRPEDRLLKLSVSFPLVPLQQFATCKAVSAWPLLATTLGALNMPWPLQHAHSSCHKWASIGICCSIVSRGKTGLRRAGRDFSYPVECFWQRKLSEQRVVQ